MLCAVWCWLHRSLLKCGGETVSHWSARYTPFFRYSRRCFYFVCAQLLLFVSKLIHVVSHHQVYYYQDVKCRDEMYDKDIVMLQVGGSQTQMCVRIYVM